MKLTHILISETDASPDYAIAYSILIHNRRPQK